jgi:hypothetical protein
MVATAPPGPGDSNPAVVLARRPTPGGPARRSCRPGLNTDTPRALASLANLNGIQAGMLLPGHGEPWTGGVEDAIRRARAAGPS